MAQETDSPTVGVPRESFPGERRVALVPGSVDTLKKVGFRVVLEAGAGMEAGFPDEQYTEKGAELLDGRDAVFEQADVIVQTRAAGANTEAGQDDLGRLRAGQCLLGMCDPLSQPAAIKSVAERGAACFALELLPRTTRAQSMDVLSSMATVAGYKAVLLAADNLPRMFPMLMTAAGTITPARVFVIGAGVAGLQAIATSRRLGAVVHAYDVRPAVREEVESLGARFIELDLKTESEGGGRGGYAQAMDEDFYRKQREMMTEVVAESDVVITTAAVPGKKAPVLITGEMVHGMEPGSIVVDLAAERGGNCELTRPDETVVEEGVTILGPANLPTTIPYHASQMFSRNVTAFLKNLAPEGRIDLDRDDDILRETLVTRNGEVVNGRVRELLEGGDATAGG